MNAGTLTFSSFDNCHYQIGRTDAPEIKARGVIQTTLSADQCGAQLDIALSGARRHQRVMASIPLNPSDLDGLIHQLQAMRDMLRSQKGHRDGA
ncbi:hypothetical protein OR16_31574 [Cupriavidus basilensis OR16]|uniref:Uncharacterized protein n=1 Tax=Cupriavidus basilensis OR16 TaxID=1127483 RepID=H1SDK9_9BURK|nr:hypothetical protein [Cupriavidus basilensis]EHP39394.1 hypothetical protein OR16_31574 [Cupriavidus basilensis OR16]